MKACRKKCHGRVAFTILRSFDFRLGHDWEVSKGGEEIMAC